MFKRLGGMLLFSLTVVVVASSSAYAIPVGWTCTGHCGTSGADGVVTAPPGGGTYDFVSTFGGLPTSGLGLGFGEVDGSILVTDFFTVNGTDVLKFNFNFVTSDGAGLDYAWARLIPTVGTPLLLMTARTCATAVCDTVPGIGMPPLASGVILVPPSTGIIPGGPVWSPLGTFSGECFAPGCGYSGWINALYTPAAGTYRLEFGVVNMQFPDYDSGMAIAGVTIGGPPVSTPEPSTFLSLGVALIGFVAMARKNRWSWQVRRAR